jgi:outer membrane protein OmpA-like peptidoglycan-associated protein
MMKKIVLISLSLLLTACAANKPPAPQAVAPQKAPVKAVSVINGNIWSNEMQEQKDKLDIGIIEYQLIIERTVDNQLKIIVPNDDIFSATTTETLPKFEPLMQKLATSFIQYPNTQIHISAHTDSTGKHSSNDPLTEDRAAKVRFHFNKAGIGNARISISGKGSRDHVAPNNTEENRAKNRRIEISVRQLAQ